MAYKPSMRSHNKVTEIPLDIRPVMNLMVVLIPILLYSAEFVKLSIRELNLPPASNSLNDASNQQDKPKEEEKRFGLTVIVAKNGFFIGNKAGYLTGDTDVQGKPAVPVSAEGKYKFELLQKKLLEIKEKIKGNGFVDEKSVVISAESDIEYKHIIRVIDFITIYEDDSGNQQELFPQINIGQVI